MEKKIHCPQLILIGGFLGAGKTSAILRIAKHLSGRGKLVGIITNDQSENLVDTRLARGVVPLVREVPGGCFCCRSDVLASILVSLATDNQPDFVIAEPVGSCTDIIATVVKPLMNKFETPFRIARYTVLLDGIRALRGMTRNEKGPQFHEDIEYIHTKQLEEADIIAVNKSELLNSKSKREILDYLAARFPNASLKLVSARSGTGILQLLNDILAEPSPQRDSIQVDYKRYASGEARLGWVNMLLQLRFSSAPQKIKRGHLARIAERVRDSLARQNGHVAHFKLSLHTKVRTRESPNGIDRVYGVCQFAGTGSEVSEVLSMNSPHSSYWITLNLRAEGSPRLLDGVVRAEIKQAFADGKIRTVRCSAFRPAAPKPIYRI